MNQGKQRQQFHYIARVSVLPLVLYLLFSACAQASDATESGAAESLTAPGITAEDRGVVERYERAAFVAEVQIAGIHRDVDRALSEPGMVAIKGYVYSAVSRQTWKGESSGLVAFRRGLDACEDKLEKGQRYLIFASPDSYGRLQLLSCEAAIPEAEAAPLLAQLKRSGAAG
ncbi:hypothetical protein [Microbulbifer yueqingensis]|uniref:Uncharacterized protein n=1 Tax=Microbulbifer yueqingensis TaxID=658219 RepID=A0A1G8ZEQ4_9GAMM|nr:hypothetical protein [Microbulbifer yueqingensis]SDK13589.1 hypothetical protein SAMN05216212_1594 [Microbulbifer yueqingensis]